MYVKDIATVISGYAFRGAIKPDVNGNVFVCQARDIRQDDPFQDVSTLTKTTLEAPGYEGYLKKHDIVMVSRGMKSGAFRSTIFAADAPNVIASSSVHVIRIKAQAVLPEYVSYFINSKRGQDALSEIVSGSYIGAVPRRELEKIEIPIPHPRQQEVLVNLYRNMREQERILERKKEIRENIINATFNKLTSKK